jgi:hypothetical protein
LRVRVEVLVDKPLRPGGFVSSTGSGKIWVDYRYERLLTFCYCCGRLGHDDRGCPLSSSEGSKGVLRYREWLRATFWGKEVRTRSWGEKGGNASPESTPVMEKKGILKLMKVQQTLGGVLTKLALVRTNRSVTTLISQNM